jgi:hypothetical protein
MKLLENTMGRRRRRRKSLLHLSEYLFSSFPGQVPLNPNHFDQLRENTTCGDPIGMATGMRRTMNIDHDLFDRQPAPSKETPPISWVNQLLLQQVHLTAYLVVFKPPAIPSGTSHVQTHLCQMPLLYHYLTSHIPTAALQAILTGPPDILLPNLVHLFFTAIYKAPTEMQGIILTEMHNKTLDVLSRVV